MTKTPAQKATEKAIELLGGVKATQELFNLKTTWAVYKWIKHGVPPERVVPLEDAIFKKHGARKVTRYHIRPDVFGSPSQESRTATP